jgi:GMP synthase (glutamine-hydrolysing)
MKLHIVMHEAFEGPAAIEIWVKNKGHTITYSRVYAGDRLPVNCDEFDFLIIMGGPQCPATTTTECKHFDAKAEIALIQQAIQSDKLILGVCLGAQLLGEAYHAPYENSPNKEIGLFSVTLTDEGCHDPIFSKFPPQFLVGHWHGDMPGLTSESKVLATSAGCPRQIVRYAKGVYGFQCHFEFTPESIANMIAHCENDLKDTSSPYIQSADELRKNDYSSANQLIFKFLDGMEELSYVTH